MNSRTALLILDAQVNKFAPATPVFAGDAVLQRLADLIERAHAQHVPVFYIQHNGGEGDPDQTDTSGWQIHPAIAPRRNDVVLQKSTPNAFHATGLQVALDAHRIRRLVIAGMQTDHCIEATCRHAEELGYDVILVADAHSTYDNSHRTAAEIVAAYNELLSRLICVQNADAVAYV